MGIIRLPVVIIALVLAILSIREQVRGGSRPVAGAAGPDVSLGGAAAMLLLGFGLRMTLILLLYRNGFVTYTLDEATRFQITWNWLQAPFFFTAWDGIWLSGSFAWFGAFIRLVGDPVTGVVTGATAGAALSIVGVYAVARAAGVRRAGAALAALLFATCSPFIAIGNGPLAESPLVGLFALGVAAAWQFLRLARSGGYPGRRWGLALGSAVCFFSAASLHYQAWMGILALLPLMAIALWVARGELSGAGWAGAAIIAVGMAAFPLAWMACSWHQFGSPLAFLHNQAVALEGHDANARERLLFYPALIGGQIVALAPLALGLLPMLRRRAERRRILLIGGFILILTALMCLSDLNGGHGSTPRRNILIVLAAVFALLAIGLEPLITPILSSPKRVYRMGLILGIGCTGLLWCRVTWIDCRVIAEAISGTYNHGLVALGTLLRQDALEKSGWPSHPPKPEIGLFSRDYGPVEAAFLGYLADCPGQVHMLEPQEDGSLNLAGIELLISDAPSTATIPLTQTPPKLTVGDWRVWTVARP